MPARSPKIFCLAGVITALALLPALAQSPPIQASQAVPPQAPQAESSLPLSQRESDQAPPTWPDMQAVSSVLQTTTPEGWEVVSPLASAPLSGFSQPVLPPGYSSKQSGQIRQTFIPAVAYLSDWDMRQLLNEYHLTDLASVSFQRGQRRVVVCVYKFVDPYSAYGAYSLLRKGASTVVVCGDATSEDDQSISFWQGSYLVLLSTTASSDDEAKVMMRALSDKISRAIVQHTQARQFTYPLPVLDRVRGSEKVVMGPIAARLVMPIPYISFLALEKSQGALCADYQMQYPRPQRLKLMISQYIDPQTAQRIYQSYIPYLGDKRRVREASPADMFRLNDQYLLCQLKDKQIIVISGARDREGVMMFAGQLMRRQNQW